jgi:hypothetical protein
MKRYFELPIIIQGFSFESVYECLHLLLAIVFAYAAFSPVDRVGLTIRVISMGYVLGAMAAAVLAIRALYRRQPMPWLPITVFVTAGCLASLGVYGLCIGLYQTPLEKEIAAMQAMSGCAQISMPSVAADSFCVTPYGMALRDKPMAALPPMLKTAFMAAEDVNEEKNLFAFDMLAQVRALTRGGREGASNVCEEYARVLGHIPHLQHGWQRYTGKIQVILECLALDGAISREDQLRGFASIASYGNFGALEIQGVQAAARIFFGKQVNDLDDTEAFILASIVRMPSSLFLVMRTGEPEEGFARRRELLRKRLVHTTANAVRHHLIDSAAAQKILERYSLMNSDPAQVADRIPPSMRLVWSAVHTAVPDWQDRYLEVKTSYDPKAQQLVEAKTQAGLERLRPLLSEALRDDLKADLTMLNLDGGIVSAVNLTTSPSDVGSEHKMLLYAWALQTGHLATMGESLHGQPARMALAKSDRDAAKELVQRISPHAYAEFLSVAGLHVSNPALIAESGYESIADGAGVSGSPNEVAAIMRMFSPRHPGVYIQPGIVSEIRDINTGKPLLLLHRSALLHPWAARAVAEALLLTPQIGTARMALGDLAAKHAIRVKTGTPHSINPVTGKMTGKGGAWCAASDNRYVIVARASLIHSEIPLQGAQACLILHEIFAAQYGIARPVLTPTHSPLPTEAPLLNDSEEALLVHR